MYARGIRVREIQGFLAEQYGTEVLAKVQQLGDRHSGRGDHGLADQAARSDVLRGVPRCAAREDSR